MQIVHEKIQKVCQYFGVFPVLRKTKLGVQHLCLPFTLIMALSESEIKDNLLKVKSYSIDQAEVLEQGSFGIVHKGTDTKINKTAVKRMHTNFHPRILTRDLDRLLHLDQEIVLKILDVEKTQDILWYIKPVCEIGDLTHFYTTRDVSPGTKVETVIQIKTGISYLQRQKIVHIEIKSRNIIVTSENPLWLKVTEFDVGKCLEPEVATSVIMSTNVRTLAFKAPEFWNTSSDKVRYHRNVDVYAAGRKFLEILHSKKGHKMLIPHIETPLIDSELIAELIKYRFPELDIATDKGKVS